VKKYETVVIFDSTLESEEAEEEIKKLSTIIEKGKGKVLDIDKWGVKKLAYPIKHQENGNYVVIYFEGDSTITSEIDRLNKINDKILRHIIVKSYEAKK
jgi:small subunit ribosomal protein S6